MRRYAFGLMVVVALIFTACQSVPVEPETPETTGGVRVYLTDRPVSSLEALYVDLSGASYQYETDSTKVKIPVELDTEANLLSLVGTEMELFDMDIPDGATLVWIGLNVQDATTVIDGEETDVEVMTKDVKILVNQQVSSDTEILLDFDVAQSLVEKGPPSNPSYSLKPVLKSFIRHRYYTTKYDITGVVKNGEGEPIQNAVIALLPTDESTVLRATFSRSDGSSVLRCVESGEYELDIFSDPDILDDGESLLDILSESDYSTDVTVEDSKVDLGEIILE